MGNMLDFLEQSFGHDSPRNASTNYHFDVFISMLESQIGILHFGWGSITLTARYVRSIC